MSFSHRSPSARERSACARRSAALVHAATTVQTLLISAILAIIVGVAFGTYPALRAARLAPIDAIHTE